MIPIKHQLRVAHINVANGMVFHTSVKYWQDSSDSNKRWMQCSSLANTILIGGDDAIEIDGDVCVNVSAPDGGVVHINGNLSSCLEIAGQSEVIITGNIEPTGRIIASGITHVYVGGSLQGLIVSTGSLAIWIDGNFQGRVETGAPSTSIQIQGDFVGTIAPVDDAALLWLVVNGFSSQESISRISNVGYTQFNAAIAYSDALRGIYPKGSSCLKLESGNSYSRWSVTYDKHAEQCGAPKSPPELY